MGKVFRGRIFGLLGSLGAALILVASFAPAATATHVAGQPGVGPARGLGNLTLSPVDATTSTTWSGYVVTSSGGPYRQAITNWTQPKVKCTAAESMVAFTAGLDGYSSATTEQVGTLAHCLN